MKQFLPDVGLDSQGGLKPAGLFSDAGIFKDAGLFLDGFSVFSDGFYFFDPESLTAGNVTSWDGSLPDSINNLSLEATQLTSGAQPVADGVEKVTFADNNDALDISSTSQAGWQIVGTSLGTFAYKIDSDPITELNLLGNLGRINDRQAGDLYGIILLPDTATPAQVEAARQLLISRGAANGVTGTSLNSFWRERRDIVEFGLIDTSNVEFFQNGWRDCNSLESFPLIDTSNAVYLGVSWYNCASLESFPAGIFDNWNPTSIANEVFHLTWKNCNSLTPQSIENILVSIATSGKYATTSGASGGTALTDPEIDIDYDGTGLTTATNTAITTLKSRGWGIVINGVLQ